MASTENLNLKRYEVENWNKIINAFFDIFEYSSLIDTQNDIKNLILNHLKYILSFDPTAKFNTFNKCR